MGKHYKDDDSIINNNLDGSVEEDSADNDFDIEGDEKNSREIKEVPEEKIAVPDFRKVKKTALKSEDSSDSVLDFSHIKDDDETKALDAFYRRNTIVRWLSFIGVGAIIVFIVYIVVSMFIAAQTPPTPIVDEPKDSIVIDTDDGTVGVASQGNFMIPLANSEGFDYENVVVNQDKVINFAGQSIVNSMNVLGLSFGNGYIIDNTNVCSLEKSTDVCFIAELKKEDRNIANIYALSNVFQTKFFTIVENIQKISIPGFEISASGQSAITGNEPSNTLFLVNSDGLTYVIVFNDNNAINDVTAHISYLPVNNM